MDPNSFDLTPKLEPNDDDTDDIYSCNYSRAPKLQWTPENTMKLIELFGSECSELWNMNNPAYNDKVARHMKLEYLADTLGTTTDDISRKLQNLRIQFNNEMRKIKKKQLETGLPAVSGWEYFESLSFLKHPFNMCPDPLDINESVNIELAEFQVKEEEVFARARAKKEVDSSPSSSSPNRKKHTARVAASAPPPLPARAINFMWTEQPRIQPGSNADECQIFGDFVASELRTLRSMESRKKLKRMIQMAILEIGAEEDRMTHPETQWEME